MAAGKICWYEPAGASRYDTITVWFDATLGTGHLKGWTGDVYAHAGVLTQESNSTSDWKHAPNWGDNSPKYKMTRSASNPDLYSLTMVPESYYGLTDDEELVSLAFVFRSPDCKVEGKDDGAADIIVDFANGSAHVGPPDTCRVTGVVDADTAVIFSNRRGRLIVTPYDDYTFKVLTLPEGTSERRSITVTARPSASHTLTETDSTWVVSTSKMQAVVSKAYSTVSFTDGRRLILAEKDGLLNNAVPRKCTFRGMADVAFYGGGYNGQRTNLNGRRLRMDNTQAYGWSSGYGGPNNICIPFVVSTSGYGLLFDDHYRGATLRPSSSGTTYQTESLNPVAYYFVGGDGSMASVLEHYTALTGHQPLPPYWSLGYISSRYGYQSEIEARSVISKIKAARLPLDGLVLDLYWEGPDASGMGNLDWYKPQFPDGAKMMADFAAQDVHTIIITEPFFTSKCANYATPRDQGFLADTNAPNMGWLLSDSVGLIDASNPAAMQWMWQFYKARTAEGVSGWWLDLGEPEQHGDNSHHVGGTVAQVHNEFGNLWVQSVYDGLRRDFPQLRPMIMPRAGTAGMQRFAVQPWTGDISRSWEGLQAQVPALLSSGMSGVALMGSDVGGFVGGGTNPQLYLRWVQMATFSPMMRTHSTYLPEPYNSDYSSVLNSVRNYLNLRYKHLPYLYSLIYENATTGVPLARPLNFYDADPAPLADSKDAYLWGRDLLVAPVVTDATQRSITFPQGTWVDVSNPGTTYSGGSTISYSAPLSKLPLFARKGSFITTFTADAFTSTAAVDASRLTVTYYLSDTATASALIYDDDHQSPTSIADGAYLLTRLRGTHDASADVISYSTEGSGYQGMPAVRTIDFKIPCYKKGLRSVTQDGDTLQRYTTLAQLQAAGQGYCQVADTLHVLARLTTETSTLRLVHDNSGITDARQDGQPALSYAGGTFRATGEGLLQVFTADGRVAMAQRLSGAGEHLVPAQLPQGIYVARLGSAVLKVAITQ